MGKAPFKKSLSYGNLEVDDLPKIYCLRCKMYPDFSFSEGTTTETLIVGVAPKMAYFEGSEMSVGAENDGCKCGSSCTCDPCTCK
ncbi:hypothetical protein HHK36_018400 [Tetracentron sinense]|uniref:Metallothionein-like protein n=1 Tax=Tetracentron sinense TaxID=13715 RepID=A0A835DAA8_TETSI|nr:hypothetical protein HHK36_018400 [Tetracentron sinense]